MASFFLRTRSSLASKNRGASHCDYISGEGRYKDKEEVAYVVDKNIPAFAKDMREFLQLADKNESDSVRSYRSLIVAIPKECSTVEDKKKWALDFTEKLLKDKHAFRLAIHDDPNNPHFQLTFSERQNTPDSLKMTPKKYFSRCNKKDRAINGKEWLAGAKELYLDHIRKVCPNYTPEMVKEERIGPKWDKAGANYEAERQARLANVIAHRTARKEFKDLDLQIKTEASTRKPAPPQPSLKPQTPQKPQTLKTDAVRLPAPLGAKAGGGKPRGIDMDNVKHDGFFIAFLKSQAPSGDAGIGAIVDSLKRMKASQEFSKQLDEKYKKVREAGFKDKTVDESADPLCACNLHCVKEMNKYVGAVLEQSIEADRQRKIQEQDPQPERYPEPPPNRHRPTLRPPTHSGHDFEFGD